MEERKEQFFLAPGRAHSHGMGSQCSARAPRPPPSTRPGAGAALAAGPLGALSQCLGSPRELNTLLLHVCHRWVVREFRGQLCFL